MELENGLFGFVLLMDVFWMELEEEEKLIGISWRLEDLKNFGGGLERYCAKLVGWRLYMDGNICMMN